MAKDFDIIILGATGYTGKLVCEELARHCAEKSNLTWAVAGRSDTKLEKTLAQLAEQTGLEFVNRIPYIVATLESQESLITVAKKAKIIINCVGPVRLTLIIFHTILVFPVWRGCNFSMYCWRDALLRHIW